MAAERPEPPTASERDHPVLTFLLQAAFDSQRRFGHIEERLSRIEERTSTLVNEVSDLRLDVKALRHDLPSRRELWGAAAFVVTSFLAIAGIAAR